MWLVHTAFSRKLQLRAEAPPQRSRPHVRGLPYSIWWLFVDILHHRLRKVLIWSEGSFLRQVEDNYPETAENSSVCRGNFRDSQALDERSPRHIGWWFPWFQSVLPSELDLSSTSDQPFFIHSCVFTILLHDENKHAEHVGAEFLLPR